MILLAFVSMNLGTIRFAPVVSASGIPAEIGTNTYKMTGFSNLRMRYQAPTGMLSKSDAA